jgi:hypothetical protein
LCGNAIGAIKKKQNTIKNNKMLLPTEEEIVEYIKQNPNSFFANGFRVGARWMKEIAEIQHKKETEHDKEK